jgi:uncharacterized membrane-anchored protein
MSTTATQMLQRAQAEGLLPADAALPTPREQRPWPVVLLTALGAWLAAFPLMGVVGMLLGPLMTAGVGPYIVGALMLAGAWVVLRAQDVPVFVEQLAVPALLTAGGSLGFGLFRDLPDPIAAAVLGALCIGFGITIARDWLRALLGASACLLFMLALLPQGDFWWSRSAAFALWMMLHATLAAWLVVTLLRQRGLDSGATARAGIAAEVMGAGWLLAAVACMAWQSGMTFMVGGAMGSGFAADLGRAVVSESAGRRFADIATAAGSVLLACAAGALAGRAWPFMRTPACLGVALVLVVLCAFMPLLGGVLLALAVTATTHRWRLAATCAVAAAWIVGAFYYQLAWPLATKALVMAGAGGLLALLVWAGQRMPPTSASAEADTRAEWPATLKDAGSRIASRRGPGWLIGLSLVAVVAACNFAIWQKEDIIASGKPVFVPLAPADPRSLMQGDFMRLNFNLPGGVRSEVQDTLSVKRPHVVARQDARGVATLTRLHTPGQPLAEGEFLIELTPKAGRWILVTDAWFFREGDAARFERARFGEFRVDPSGRALLVGMAGEDLRRIEP